MHDGRLEQLGCFHRFGLPAPTARKKLVSTGQESPLESQKLGSCTSESDTYLRFVTFSRGRVTCFTDSWVVTQDNE